MKTKYEKILSILHCDPNNIFGLKRIHTRGCSKKFTMKRNTWLKDKINIFSSDLKKTPKLRSPYRAGYYERNVRISCLNFNFCMFCSPYLIVNALINNIVCFTFYFFSFFHFCIGIDEALDPIIFFKPAQRIAKAYEVCEMRRYFQDETKRYVL